MIETTNFGLKKREGTDLFNTLNPTNENLEKIDTVMKTNADNSVAEAHELKSGSVHAITRTNPDGATFHFTATSDFVAGDTFTVDSIQVTAITPNGEALGTGAFKEYSEVMGTLVGTHLTLYVSGGVVEVAEDSNKLGGELPAYYATKSALDSTQLVAESAGVLAGQASELANEALSKVDGIGTPVLLWENDSPLTTFAPQTVNVNLANYKKALIVCRTLNSQNDAGLEIGSPYGYIETSHECYVGFKIMMCSGNYGPRWRACKVNTDSVEFGYACDLNGNIFRINQNNTMIPYKIYGVK